LSFATKKFTSSVNTILKASMTVPFGDTEYKWEVKSAVSFRNKRYTSEQTPQGF